MMGGHELKRAKKRAKERHELLKSLGLLAQNK